MAKIYGLFGAMSGKVADVVMSVRNGQQIVRKYQPVVANPKTQNQFSTRARFKLLSQLSAVMASVIAIPREGGVSSRNIFTKINFPITTFADMQAQITLTSIKITKGILPIPSLVLTSTGGTQIDASLAAGGQDIDRMVYAAFLKTADNNLRLVRTAVQNDAGASGVYSTTLTVYPQGEYIVYGYGIRDNTKSASVYFGNLTVLTAETIAKIIVSRTLLESDITISESVASEVTVGE